MRKEKKSVYLCALVLLFTMLLTACSEQISSGNELGLIDSKVSYDLVVPTQSGKAPINVFFSVPFYRICSEDTMLTGDSEWDNVQEFVVGDGVEVYGENVEAINGMTISITQSPLKEVVGNDKEKYTDDLIDSFEKKYEKKINNSEDIAALVDNYYENAYLISAMASYDGIVENDVIITSITIPEIDFSYSFDSFTISTEEIENSKNIIDDNGDAIEYSAYSGSFMDSFISRLGYYHLEGEALCKIDNMKLISLDDKCTVIDESNYSEYGGNELLTGISEPEYVETLEKGESVDQDYYYLFKSIDADAIVTNLALETTDSEGTERWLTIYQPSSIAGQYLVTKAIYEALR